MITEFPATRLDQPTVSIAPPKKPEWGSDVAAAMLRLLGFDYVALNPGASYRGLHDSLVNYQGNERPGMILCNHEEVAVAIAQGYAKLTGRAMAAALHSNVGLMHGSMGIFDAFCDRQPVFILGGTGPMDSTSRRPWIDWIHTANNQGGLVRDFTKWEHQPSSVEAIPEAFLRGWQLAMAEPRGPVYLCLDAGLQEQRLEQAIELPDIARYPLPAPIEPPAEAVRQAAQWLAAAQRPVILLGRSGGSQQAWDDLVALAELLGAAVLGDNKSRSSFPSDHYLSQAPYGRPGAEFNEVLSQADVVLALDRVDPAGALKTAYGQQDRQRFTAAPKCKLINVSLDSYAVRSWTTDYQELPPADLPILANAERTVAALLEEARRAVHDDSGARQRIEQRSERYRAHRKELEAKWRAHCLQRWDATPISVERMVGELRAATGGDYEQTIMARLPHAWPSGVWDFCRPGAYLGSDGGGGVGSGPGIAVGIALAARQQRRPVVSVHGDGDMLMAPTALWTAAHHRIPLLFVVANNHSYFNDEEHQDTIARKRGRPPENRWIGQRLDDPAVDFAGLARDLGAEGFGPVSDPDDLADVFKSALATVRDGNPALVDVHISPR